MKTIFGLPAPLGFTPLKSRAEGQVLKYDFEGPLSPIVMDKSGHMNNASLEPYWPENSARRFLIHDIPPNVGLGFEGDDYARTLEDLDIFIPEDSSFSICIWAYAYPRNRTQCVLDGSDRALAFVSLEFPRSGNEVRCTVRDDKEATKSISYPAEVYYKWWHYTIIRRYRDTCELWVNGDLAGTAKDTLGTLTWNGLTLGARTTHEKFLAGGVDMVRLFNRALSEREIRHLYEAERRLLLL